MTLIFSVPNSRSRTFQWLGKKNVRIWPSTQFISIFSLFFYFQYNFYSWRKTLLLLLLWLWLSNKVRNEHIIFECLLSELENAKRKPFNICHTCDVNCTHSATHSRILVLKCVARIWSLAIVCRIFKTNKTQPNPATDYCTHQALSASLPILIKQFPPTRPPFQQHCTAGPQLSYVRIRTETVNRCTIT